MEEEKVEWRVRRGERRDEVTGGIKVNEKGKRQSEQREWKFPCGSRMTPMVAPPPPPPRDDALCRDQYGGSRARVLPCIVTRMGLWG